jgi:RNA polymerase sigma-70 factor (ECF subfamily)
VENLSDETLVARVLKGENAAFGILIKRYEKQIYSFAYNLTNNKDDAQDFAQEAFIKIYNNLHKYDKSRSFFPWMYKVSTNVCYSKLKQSRPKVNEVPLEKVIEFSPLIPDRATNPEEYSQTRELQRLVKQAITELPEKYRVPLVLKYLEDMSYKDISDTMDIPISTIETRLYRGRALLQKRLAVILERGERNEVSGK